MTTRTYFKFTCQGCNKEFDRRSDKKSQSPFCRPCRGRKTLLKHGQSRSRLYHIWVNVRNRCQPHNIYGRKGISVCQEWEVFEPFYTWATAHGYEDSLSIDRINPWGNYEPSNCRWTTDAEQSRNRTIGLTWDNVKKIRSLCDKYTYQSLAEQFGVCKSTVALVSKNKIWFDPEFKPLRRFRWQKTHCPTPLDPVAISAPPA